MLHIAIIGSGPAGCYLADQLLRLAPSASIDIVERLPVPFGLIRYGVAPDHQPTKAVARLFDRVLSRKEVGFFGNVEVGRDVRLAQLMELYDVVVLATGASRDRQLGIPGEGLPGVVGSGAFVGWYNGHPDRAMPRLENLSEAVVIGNGNVALDVARVLAKGRTELTGSDLPAGITQLLAQQPLRKIHIVGRRGAADAKFNEHELAELGTLRRAKPVVADATDLSGDTPVLKVLREFAANARPAEVEIIFHFNLTPTAFLGEDRLRAVQFRSASGDMVEIPAQLAVTAIGYHTPNCCTAETTNGVFPNQGGKISDRLYTVGWAKRGPSGTIPTNRTEAQQVAQKIVQEAADEERAGGEGLRKLLQQAEVEWIDYAAWKRVDAAELARATGTTCRQKFLTVAEMLEAAQASQLRDA